MDCKKFIVNLIKAINVNRRPNETTSVVNEVSLPELDNAHTEDTDEVSCNETVNKLLITTPVNKKNNSPQSLKYRNTRQSSPPNIEKDVVYLYDHFYMAHFNDNLIFFENYNNRHCPLKGWFQDCVRCNTITGRLYTYGSTTKRTLLIRMCDNCSRNFDKFRDTPRNLELDDSIRKGVEIYKNIILYI